MRGDGQGRHADQPVDDRATGELDRVLASLMSTGELSADQAARLRAAAAQDRAVAEAPRRAGEASTGVLDVVGYVGGALMLGALVFVGFTLWGDLSRAGRIVVAVAAFVVPTVGGIALVAGRTRRGLALALLAIAALAAGFAAHTVAADDDLVLTAAVITGAGALGAATLRAPLLYLPTWLGAMGLVASGAESVLDPPDEATYATWLSVGFLAVGLIFLGAGTLLGRQLAWSLAGLSGLIAVGPLLAFDRSVLALGLGTLVAALLFTGMIRLQAYALGVVGGLAVLSTWPAALYQLVGTAIGVALGLVAAGAVLIGAAVLLSRRRRQRPNPSR